MRVSYESDVYGEEGLHREHDGDTADDLDVEGQRGEDGLGSTGLR